MLSGLVWVMAGLALVAVFVTRGFRSSQYRPFVFSVVLSGLAEFIALWAMMTQGTNILVYNIYMPLEFTLLMWYAADQMGGPMKRLWPLSVLGFMMLWSLEMVLMTDHTLTMTTKAFTCAILVLGPLYFFLLYRQADRTEIPLLHSPHFWANFSILLSFVALGPAMGLLRFLVQEDSPLAFTVTFIFPLIASVRFALSITSMWIHHAAHEH